LTDLYFAKYFDLLRAKQQMKYVPGGLLTVLHSAVFLRFHRNLQLFIPRLGSENVNPDAHVSNSPNTDLFDSSHPALLIASTPPYPDDWGSFPRTQEHIQEFWQGNPQGKRCHQLNPIKSELTEV
jgi:hypothetical protein